MSEGERIIKVSVIVWSVWGLIKLGRRERGAWSYKFCFEFKSDRDWKIYQFWNYLRRISKDATIDLVL